MQLDLNIVSLNLENNTDIDFSARKIKQKNKTSQQSTQIANALRTIYIHILVFIQK
jgi:hypothetical protein